ncbi:MAG: prepilin-type N-terminal cleavage/methylation domain-containing protein [Uliginosibacterium sp.]|jgi:general secretion pathway protein G|nr:prepilin-type N-terminal cleavage/methylation domain-containing protein [Uliginosibacterium sp.]
MRLRAHGFTLIEMLVVLAILSVLLTISLPRYFRSQEVARERVLIENIRVTREAIDRFSADLGRYPESLAELSEKRYIREIPIDPILERNDAWQLIGPPSEKKGQVFDIKSTAPGFTSDGRAFSEL